SRNPLFQAMFALQNAPRHDGEFAGLRVTVEPDADEPAMFDLLLLLEERDESLVGSVNYATDLFDRSTVARWMECFEVVLREIAADTSRRIGEIPILPQAQREEVVKVFNATSSPYSRERLIHELVEEQARQTPQSAA